MPASSVQGINVMFLHVTNLEQLKEKVSMHRSGNIADKHKLKETYNTSVVRRTFSSHLHMLTVAVTIKRFNTLFV